MPKQTNNKSRKLDPMEIGPCSSHMHKPELVLENENAENYLRLSDTNESHVIPARRWDQILINNKKIICHPVNLVVFCEFYF